MSLNSQDYFPSKPNTKYIYKGFKNSSLNFIRYEEFNTESQIQVKFTSNDASFINVYEYSPEGVKLTLCENNATCRKNLITEKKTIDDFLIKEPIEKDNIWFLSDGSKRMITSVDAKVNTIYKYFLSALEITTISKNNSVSIDYYVKDIGIVKSIYYIDNVGLLSYEIEDIIEDTPITEKIKVFYPDSRLNSIWFIEKDLNFYTNDSMSFSFEKAFENPLKGLLPTFNFNTSINNLYFDFYKKNLYVDLSKNYLDLLSNYSNKSFLFIKSIYETFREYYDTPNIFITIDKEPFKLPLDYISSASNIFFSSLQNKKWIIYNCNFPITYVVKENDTLVSIAEKFETSYLKLAKINNIKNPNYILPNQILQICAPGVYKVKDADTIYSIADKFEINYEDLIKINNIPNPLLVKPGLNIKLH